MLCLSLSFTAESAYTDSFSRERTIEWLVRSNVADLLYESTGTEPIFKKDPFLTLQTVVHLLWMEYLFFYCDVTDIVHAKYFEPASNNCRHIQPPPVRVFFFCLLRFFFFTKLTFHILTGYSVVLARVILLPPNAPFMPRTSLLLYDANLLTFLCLLAFNRWWVRTVLSFVLKQSYKRFSVCCGLLPNKLSTKDEEITVWQVQ